LRFHIIIIPSTVTSVGNFAFANCYNVIGVVYLGKKNDPINESIFSECGDLSAVCVPSNYNSSTFCGRKEVCKGNIEQCKSNVHNNQRNTFTKHSEEERGEDWREHDCSTIDQWKPGAKFTRQT